MANKDKEEKKVLSIIKEDGTKEEVELLICFTFNDTKKEYVVYTRNEKDENLYTAAASRSLRTRIERLRSGRRCY